LLPLRYPTTWALLGWLLVVGVATGSLLPGPVVAQVMSYNDKLMHASSYFVLMVWFGGLYPRGKHLRIAVALLGLGVALDLLQGLTATRSLDIFDIAANTVGLVLGLVLSMSLLEGWCQRLERRLLT
jgi:VanZ family protein